jgi:hypothetical protein
MLNYSRAIARLARRKRKAAPRLSKRDARRIKSYAVAGAFFGLWAAIPGASNPMPPSPRRAPVVIPFETSGAPLPPDFWYRPKPHVGETVTPLEVYPSYPNGSQKRDNKRLSPGLVNH